MWNILDNNITTQNFVKNDTDNYNYYNINHSNYSNQNIHQYESNHSDKQQQQQQQKQQQHVNQTNPTHHIPIHIILHNGDFLSVESILQNKMIILLDLLLRPDSSTTTWMNELKDTEKEIKDLYR